MESHGQRCVAFCTCSLRIQILTYIGKSDGKDPWAFTILMVKMIAKFTTIFSVLTLCKSFIFKSHIIFRSKGILLGSSVFCAFLCLAQA